MAKGAATVRFIPVDRLNDVISTPDFVEGMDLFMDEPFPPARSEEVVRAVEALPEPRRSVVEMIVWGGWAQREVAVELGITRQAVGYHWALAKAELGSILNV